MDLFLQGDMEFTLYCSSDVLDQGSYIFTGGSSLTIDDDVGMAWGYAGPPDRMPLEIAGINEGSSFLAFWVLEY